MQLLSLPQDDISNPGTPSSVEGGGGGVKGALWSKKDRQEAGAFLGQFDPSKSGRARRKKNTNYSQVQSLSDIVTTLGTRQNSHNIQ